MSQQKIQAPKGTADVLPADAPRWQAVEKIARDVAAVYHYGEIRTPIFEHTELFHRGVGESSDIVSKETYTFDDRGGRSLTLRPEGTAGVARAMIEHNLVADQGARHKVFYLGSNFRYERPQSGRLRIHHQFGVEAFGVAEPEQDVECILLQMEFYRRCGVRDLALRLNSLGDRDSKQRYRDALVQFLAPKTAGLSEESQRRLETNPLRILDSKDPRDIEACKGAPPAIESLSEASRAHFERVQQLLIDAMSASLEVDDGVRVALQDRSGTGGENAVTNVKPVQAVKSVTVRRSPFTVDGSLVRGFDYYTGTLWEVTAGGLGAQNAIGGGGRYDALIEQLGGRPTPAVGFGSGIERLLLALEMQKVELPIARKRLVWLISMGDAAKAHNLKLLNQLRAAGIPADMDFAGRGMKGQIKLADREQATHAIIVGDDELTSGQLNLKTLGTGEQMALPAVSLIHHLLKD